ncbi:Tyrosine recombinase XerC [Polaribacter huanghezhanensis]|nr:Tyrosine recombinase XerC [Polaribacter huanghezhanensis]
MDENYQSVHVNFQDHPVPNAPLESLTQVKKNHLRKYMIALNKNSPRTIKRKVASIKAYYNFLEFEEVIIDTPFRKIKLNIKIEKLLGSSQGHLQFKNTEKGFVKFLQILNDTPLVVMETTGYYHYRLAQFLHKKEQIVSVVNPLSVKHFIQMKLAKVKTDKSDAKAICEYGLTQEVPLYNALTDVQSECLQLFRLMDNFIKKRTATKNKLHGEEVLGIPSKYVYRSLKRDKKHLDKELKGIEEKLLSLVKQDQQQQLTLLQSIPGLGLKTALFLIVVTDGFKKFETASQLCSYV